jgi:hypothetical protein
MFLNNYRWYFSRIYRRNEAGNLFYASVPSVNPSVIIFFLLPTDLPMEKKLPMKNSLTEHFRR